MARSMRHGERKGGFTLVELLLVLLLVALLASLAAPTVIESIGRARESTLREDLHVLRKALDDYHADHGRYPVQLDDLVDKRYLRRIPPDPMTGEKTWQVVIDEPEEGEETGGIRDVHSGAEGQARDGAYFKDW